MIYDSTYYLTKYERKEDIKDWIIMNEKKIFVLTMNLLNYHNL